MAKEQKEQVIQRQIQLELIMQGFQGSAKEIKSIYDELEKIRSTNEGLDKDYAALNSQVKELVKNLSSKTKIASRVLEGHNRIVKGVANSYTNWHRSVVSIGKSLLTGVVSLKSVNYLEEYNKALIAGSVAAKKYGISLQEFNGKIRNTSEALGMTRQSTLEFFSVFERRMPNAIGYLDKAGKMLESISKVAGPNPEVQQKYSEMLFSMVDANVQLQKVIENIGDPENQKILVREAENLYQTQKFSLEQKKMAIEFAKQEGVELTKEQEILNKFKNTQHDINIALAKGFLPALMSVSEFLKEHEGSIKNIGSLLEKTLKIAVKFPKTSLAAFFLSRPLVNMGASMLGGGIGRGGASLIGKGAVASIRGASRTLTGSASLLRASFLNLKGVSSNLVGVLPSMISSVKNAPSMFSTMFSGFKTTMGSFSSVISTSAIPALNGLGVAAGAAAAAFAGWKAGRFIHKLAFGEEKEYAGVKADRWDKFLATRMAGVTTGEGLWGKTKGLVLGADPYSDKAQKEQRERSGELRERRFNKRVSDLSDVNITGVSNIQDVEAKIKSLNDMLKTSSEEESLKINDTIESYKKIASISYDSDFHDKIKLETQELKKQLNSGTLLLGDEDKTQKQLEQLQKVNKVLTLISGKDIGVKVGKSGEYEIKESQQLKERLDTYIGINKERLSVEVEMQKLTGQIDNDSVKKIADRIRSDLEARKKQIEKLREIYVSRGNNVDFEAFRQLGKAGYIEKYGSSKYENKIASQQTAYLDYVKQVVEYDKDIDSILQSQQEVFEKEKSNLDTSIDLVREKSNIMQNMISLADNFAIGVGASAKLRQESFKVLQSEIDMLSEKAKKYKNEIQAGRNIQENQKQLLQINNEILSKQQQQAQTVRALRDGWIEAIGAMNTGAGVFSKIVISQNKNVAQGIRMAGKAAVLSSKSGSFGEGVGVAEGGPVGYKRSSKFSAYGGISGPGGQSTAYKVGRGLNDITSSQLESMQRGDISQSINMLSGEMSGLGDKLPTALGLNNQMIQEQAFEMKQNTQAIIDNNSLLQGGMPPSNKQSNSVTVNVNVNNNGNNISDKMMAQKTGEEVVKAIKTVFS